MDDLTRPRPSRGADIGAALLLVVVEVLAVVGVFGAWFLADFTIWPTGEEEPVSPNGYLVAFGVIAAVAGAAAFVAFRSRAVVTGVLQVVMAGVIVLGVLGLVHAYGAAGDEPAPAFTGEVGCRSGGDSHECADTGG